MLKKDANFDEYMYTFFYQNLDECSIFYKLILFLFFMSDFKSKDTINV